MAALPSRLRGRRLYLGIRPGYNQQRGRARYGRVGHWWSFLRRKRLTGVAAFDLFLEVEPDLPRQRDELLVVADLGDHAWPWQRDLVHRLHCRRPCREDIDAVRKRDGLFDVVR